MPARAASFILLVEDCPNDGFVLRQALRRFRATLDLHQVRSLEEARSFLGSAVDDRRAPHPACVILDLDLPDGDGLTLIDWMHERGAAPPVVVLSGAPQRAAATPVGRRAAAVLEKPETLDGYGRLADMLGRLLLSATGAPPANDNFTAA